MYNQTFTPPNHWAVILAGGDGTRLQLFTEALFGDRRPKQFCRLLGQYTLLASTRMRLVANVAPQRTLAVVTRHHEPFYRDELSSRPATAAPRWRLSMRCHGSRAAIRTRSSVCSPRIITTKTRAPSAGRPPPPTPLPRSSRPASCFSVRSPNGRRRTTAGSRAVSHWV